MTEQREPQRDTTKPPTNDVEPDAAIEVVVDLDADDDSDVVRGGCVRSLPGGCVHTAGV